MSSLVCALFTTAILIGIALTQMLVSGSRPSGTTNLIWTVRMDLTPDAGSTMPGPTDPNGPST
jgi:hypothetical protein